MSSEPDWWKGALIYQIYPRSFQDTNNNGIGDLNGITKHLEYISSLGVDGIWVSPFFTPPMKDFGYDISDYRAIDPLFGNISDFDELLEKAHSLNLKIIIDLAMSHTSEEHPWFSDKTKKDWYVWADAKYDQDGNKEPPNNWVSVFGGSAWQWDETNNQYYFHNFLKEQPDLNFHNPDVQEEIIDTCKFWLDRGVDGIRLDVVNFYFHDQLLRDNPPRQTGGEFATQLEKETPYSNQQHIYDKSRPENLDFIAKLRSLSNQYSDRVLIGEIGDDHPYKLAQQYTDGTKHLHTCYNPHMMSGTHKELTEDIIRVPIETFFNVKNNDANTTAWPSWAFSNHDVVRAASRWYKPYGHNPQFSKMIIALLGCLPGSAFMFQGEELGLPEAEIPLDKIQDPWAKETLPEWQGRDGCRTPMVWNNLNNCGFSTAETWLPIPGNHYDLNVTAQSLDNSSVLNFTRRFIDWRKNTPTLISGEFVFLKTNNKHMIEIIREDKQGNKTHCTFNLSDKEITYKEGKYSPHSFYISGFDT